MAGSVMLKSIISDGNNIKTGILDNTNIRHYLLWRLSSYITYVLKFRQSFISAPWFVKLNYKSVTYVFRQTLSWHHTFEIELVFICHPINAPDISIYTSPQRVYYTCTSKHSSDIFYYFRLYYLSSLSDNLQAKYSKSNLHVPLMSIALTKVWLWVSVRGVWMLVTLNCQCWKKLQNHFLNMSNLLVGGRLALPVGYHSTIYMDGKTL